MIFQFPDYDTLRLALTSGVVPPAVGLEPAAVGADAQGRPWVEPAGRVPRGLAAQLGELGVLTAREAPGPAEPMANWLQALPLARHDQPPEPGGSTPVLFELADAGQLPEVVGEMLRLSVDRQSFRWMKGDGASGGAVLLRVVGPPYYTLLRALDRDRAGRAAKVRAYVEQAPRVWVEVGWSHPLVKSIVPTEGQVLLMRGPRDWVFVADAPFREIYDILDFKLPQARLDWEAAELRKRLIVPLKLIEGDRQDPELWVLRDHALDQLDALVRDARESLVQRLIFSVGERGGNLTVVLRVRPSKQPPPQLVLEAEAYAKYLKLDNLFVPAGSRIHPVLRRDAVRKLLADDPAQVNWLRADPEKRGGFIPESLPDDSFRPLQDWVDYVLDHDRAALTHWVQEFKFDFDPFVCPEDLAEAKPRPGGGRRRRGAGDEDENEPKPTRVVTPPKAPPEEPAAPDADDYATIEILPPSQVQVELHELEQRFVAPGGAMDDLDRLRLWPDMAVRNAALKRAYDAGICWMNLLWEVLDTDVELADLRNDPDEARQKARRERVDRLRRLADSFGGEAELAWQWLRSEKILTDKRLTTADLDRLLKNDQPPDHEVRGLVACLVWGSRDPAHSRAILQRLPQLQQYLGRHEKVVGLRAVWFAWHALAKLSGDPLALARARDRIIERLVGEGYNADRNLATFLRTAGHQDRERMRDISNHIADLRELALTWCAECEDKGVTVKQTSAPYVDLIFAFGLARLGESMRARELLKAAEVAVAAKKPARGAADDTYEIHDFLLRAFRYRIEQVLQGRPHQGPLPPELRVAPDHGAAKGVGQPPSFIIDRMRQQSQILEPQESPEPYRDYTHRHVSDLDRRLAALQDVKDGRQLQAMVHELIKSGAGKPPTAEDVMAILADALPLSQRVGESFALDLLARVEPTLDKLPSGGDPLPLLKNQALLLDGALFMAANYERVDVVQKLWPRFVQILQKSQQSKSPTAEVNRLFGQCLRSMRKLGLRDDIGKMIRQAEELVRGNRSIEALQAAAGKDWPLTLTTLLHLAGGWLVFGDVEKATPVLDAARELLFSREEKSNADGLFPQQYANLAVAYITVLGQAPVELAMKRITQLFGKMRRLKDTFTTAKYYARLHLNIVEAVVLAVVSEDFAMGPAARKWMDDDEYLVRRRVHRDHRAMLAKA